MARCIELSDPAALDASKVGAKAAALARARSLGLPVLDGVVVPVNEARPVVERAVAALERGPAVRARLAAMGAEPDAELLAELGGLVSALGEPLIVRSSSPLEADGVWSGAFSSFHDVDRQDMRTAIRGVWGSAFSVDVLERCEEVGTAPAQLGLGVLIQPQLTPAWGGSARVEQDGTVVIAATSGPLRALMEGWVEGELGRVGPDDRVSGTARTPEDILVAAAQLARDVRTHLGHRLIEWAYADGRIALLQSQRSEDFDAARADAVAPVSALGTPTALRIAALTQRFPGALASDLILPWALAPGFSPEVPAPQGPADAAEAFAEACALAGQLTARVWQASPRAAHDEAERTLRQLRGTEPSGALERIDRLGPVDTHTGRRVLALLAQVQRQLVASGRLDDPAWLFRSSVTDVGRLLDSDAAAPPRRLGVDRWEPFAHAVVMTVGRRYEGMGVVHGAGAGWAHVVSADAEQTAPSGRYVLVAEQLMPRLAPLLWHAAGLVTRAGNPGAHLLEVARSVGVPTVLGCPIDVVGDHPALIAPALIAVDGGSGQIAVANPDA